MSDPGYIYVLINHAMPTLVKVGKTTRDTESRAQELSSVTGVPTPFLVVYDAYFNNCSKAENYIHDKLAQIGYRLSQNREFFQAPLKEVIRIVVEAQHIFKPESLIPEGDPEADKTDEGIQNDLQKEPWSELEAVAIFYFNSENYEEAYRLFREALNVGSKNAYYYLGSMTQKGLGCLEDEEESFNLLKKGADNGQGLCCAELANYYFAKEFWTGIKWLEKYLESGDKLKPDVVFHCFVNFVTYEKNDKFGYLLRDFLRKYKHVLKPLKDEIISYAIKSITYVANQSPASKQIYSEVGREIKNIL